MVVNLIKNSRMFSITLPNKVKGQYWIMDVDDNGQSRRLIRIEAVKDNWILKSNKNATILDSEKKYIESTIITSHSCLSIQIKNSNEKAILFSEEIDDSRLTFKKYVITKPDVISIGRAQSNSFYIANDSVSNTHAKLSFDGQVWTITDLSSTNGTYVNGYRVETKVLSAGDYIYIMGLCIIIGRNFIAVNNPDNLLRIQSPNLLRYVPQQIEPIGDLPEIQEETHFFRSPRFYREVEHAEIKIDPPPQIQKPDTVPLALMLGPALTMGMTSLTTGLMSFYNVMSSSGNIVQALPMLMMSVGMLCGTVLWPIFTKKYEKKQKEKNERKRQNKYLAYLDSIRDEIKRKSKEQKDILEENLVKPEECANRIAQENEKLWERVNGQSDFLRMRLGIGSLPLDASVKYNEKKFSMEDDNLQDAMYSLGTEPKNLSDVPISFSFTEHTTVGLCGSLYERNNMLKSFILQLIALHSYDELKIVLIADDNEKDTWNFVRPIPHFWDNEKTIRFMATDAEEIKELSAYMEKKILPRLEENSKDYSKYSPYYIIISTSKELPKKCESLQRIVKSNKNIACSVLFAAEQFKDLPKETKLVISLDELESKMFDRDDTTGKSIAFVPDIVNDALLDATSFDIANIKLDLESQRFSLPSSLNFLEMFNVSKVEHLNSLTRWKENNATKSLQTPIGVDSYGGTFNLDIHEKFHGPHGLIAGMTGSGKSQFIISYILSLAVNYHPDEVAFMLIDYKGSDLVGTFINEERGIKLPHLAGVITNLDGAAISRSLLSINSEIKRRQTIFKEAIQISNEGTMDIYKYQQLYRDNLVSEPLPHLLIIIDEFAELKKQQTEFMTELNSISRIGRSLGVHLILATQKPSGVVDPEIWSNSRFRACLKVQEKADSMDVIKHPDAAELSQAGRFYLQVGYNEIFALGQSAWSGAEYVPTETVIKTVDSSIQVVDNMGRVIVNVKPGKKKVEKTDKNISQALSVVAYLSNLAAEENISVRPIWLDPIPEKIYLDDIIRKYNVKKNKFELDVVVGEYDDPARQTQNVLTVPFSKDGNCLVYGSSGNGKTTLLTTLVYSIVKNYTADEVNLYIIDFGSETLKVFEKAPQVGDVMTAVDSEKITNLIKMISEEKNRRKNIFSEYGGDYYSYCRNSGETLPNIVIAVNNYAGLSEQFSDIDEYISSLTMDCAKYGIFFIITATAPNDVRNKIRQNFNYVLSMQLNDPTDYPIVLGGKTEGIIPSKFKGRGLVKLDRVHEFQTAYATDKNDILETIRAYCAELSTNVTSFADSVPILPETVRLSNVRSAIKGLSSVPAGIIKENLAAGTVNIEENLVFPVTANSSEVIVPFIKEFVSVICSINKVTVIDEENAFSDFKNNNCIVMGKDKTNEAAQMICNDLLERHKAYKLSNYDESKLEKFEEKVYVICGIDNFISKLDSSLKVEFTDSVEGSKSIYKVHIIIADDSLEFKKYKIEPWLMKNDFGSNGIWVGDGIANQTIISLNKFNSVLREQIEDDYGYIVRKKNHKLVKLLSSKTEESEYNGW